MFSSSSILDVLFVFIVTVCIAYIFGFILVKMVDNKMSQIKIEIPSSSLENFENKKDKNEVIVYQKYDIQQDDKGNQTIKNISSMPVDYKFDNQYYQQMNEFNKVEHFSDQPTVQPLDWTPNDLSQNQRTCIKDHVHKKEGRDDSCKYGVTNYADPKDMSPIDLNIYMLNYPPNFTLQDYINWLWCFKDRKTQLTYNHLRNLEKLELGKELKYENGVCPPPSYYHPPMNSEDYFSKLYNNNNEFEIAESLNSTTGPMLGYNFGNYSEFSQNKDVYGLSGELRNPDIGLKKTAADVDNYIIPHDSQNLAIEKAFKPYHVKKVEI